jgi:RNA polymerase sigma-70 factor (ECF subfamily)
MLLNAVRAKNWRKSTVTSWRKDPDVVLMLRVQRDDAAAFAELVERYRVRVFGHFLRRLADRQDAEDLTQEVFLRLYRHRKRYKPQARFATWLFHITHNLACNAIRSRQKRRLVRLDPDCGSDEHDAPKAFGRRGEFSPARSMEQAELAGIVRAAVSGLAQRQRTAVELHQFHDHTYAEVAAELDMSAKAAKSLLYRARGQLRETLAGVMATHA